MFGVPKINLMMEIKKEFKKFGELESFILVTDKVASQGKLEECKYKSFSLFFFN